MSNNPIDIATCNGSAEQQWTFQPDGTIAAQGYCLDAHPTTSSTIPVLHSCDSNASMQWQALSSGALMNPSSGLCLDDPSSSTTSGTQLQMATCGLTTAQMWASAVHPAFTTPVGTMLSNGSGLCVDNRSSNFTSGNPVQVYTCNGTSAQRWTFQADGTITIAGLCLDNTSAGTANGNPITIHTCNGNPSQQWTHPDTGAIVNPATSKCIYASPNTSGTQLQLYDCNPPARPGSSPATDNHQQPEQPPGTPFTRGLDPARQPPCYQIRWPATSRYRGDRRQPQPRGDPGQARPRLDHRDHGHLRPPVPRCRRPRPRRHRRRTREESSGTGRAVSWTS